MRGFGVRQEMLKKNESKYNEDKMLDNLEQLGGVTARNADQ